MKNDFVFFFSVPSFSNLPEETLNKLADVLEEVSSLSTPLVLFPFLEEHSGWIPLKILFSLLLKGPIEPFPIFCLPIIFFGVFEIFRAKRFEVLAPVNGCNLLRRASWFMGPINELTSSARLDLNFKAPSRNTSPQNKGCWNYHFRPPFPLAIQLKQKLLVP